MFCLRPLVFLAALLSPLAAVSASETWNFDVTTTGQDIHYVSPTNVDPDSPGYQADYQLDLLEVRVKYLGLNFGPFDVTGEIPPEFQTGSGTIAGRAPLLLFGQDVAYPEPPAAPSLAANLSMSLDGAGFGHVDATNVVLGTIAVNLGIFGTVNAQITSLRIKGSVSVAEIRWVDLGLGLGGSGGVTPALWGTGELIAGTPLTLELSDALVNSTAVLILGFSRLDAAFKGGVLVPQPDLLITGLPTGAGGGFALGATWPAGVPSGFTLYFQAWIADGGAPAGFSASNGLSGTAQ